MGPKQSEHNKRQITLTVITLSGFHCNMLCSAVNKAESIRPNIFYLLVDNFSSRVVKVKNFNVET